MKISRIMGLVAGLGLIWAWVALPPLSETGELTDLTVAYATADMPSGVYYNRDFDWPTGEALWVDFPACALHAFLLGFLLLCVGHDFVDRMPRNDGEEGGRAGGAE